VRVVSMRFTLGRRSVLVAALTLFALNASALPLHVTLEWASSISSSARPRARIQAVQTAGPNRGGAPVDIEAGVDGAVLNLSAGVWQLQASASGYWSEGAEVVVNRQTRDGVRLVFWPAASLHGAVVTPGGETLPDSLELLLSATTAYNHETNTLRTSRPVLGPSHARIRCPINSGIWSCVGPAGLFDVRLEAGNYAPHYEWGVSLKENIDLGKTELLRVASVFGRIVRNDGSIPPGPCRATLRPDMARRGPGDPDQEADSGSDANTSYPVSLNPRGYFQVIGVAPGRYALAVGCQDASGFRNLRVQGNSETRIDPPLVLENLALDISLTPKSDPTGKPWKLAVYETGPHYLLIADGATTSADGRWIRHGLMAGNYHVVVRGSDGAAWLQKYFDLRKNSEILLHVSSVSVAGRVMMSSQPVRARLVFNNNAGGGATTLVSDDNGRFHGLLPGASATQTSSWTVQAHVVQPPLTQQLLGVIVRPDSSGASWLDLDLPAIPVRGSVVSPDGKPQPHVEVIFEKTGGAQTTTGTDDAGRFEMTELPAGKYTARANSPNGTSDRTRFAVTEASSTELKLVLNPFKGYSLNIVSNQGPVPDAAVQVWIAPGVPRAFERTDENGHLDVTLPPGIKEVGLTIGAPGFAIKLARLLVSSSSGDDSPDAHTVTLDTAAGTLVLNFQQPGHALDTTSALYLVHKGAIQDARTIAGWGTNQTGANINGPVTVEMIEPGDYALCRVDPTQVSLLWMGSLPPDRCRKGTLEEGETLTLSPQ
jgi:hypothetical protein